jgi:uncharacterized membrane protein
MQRVERSVRVASTREALYEMWRNFENFPRFMEHVESVQVSGADKRHSHWKLKAPLGMSAEFDAEISEDEPNKSIGWRSLDGNIGMSGNVTFAELETETQVHVIMQWFDPPGGPIGEFLSRTLQNPEVMLEEDLRRFKHWAESQTGTSVRANVA